MGLQSGLTTRASSSPRGTVPMPEPVSVRAPFPVPENRRAATAPAKAVAAADVKELSLTDPADVPGLIAKLTPLSESAAALASLPAPERVPCTHSAKS